MSPATRSAPLPPVVGYALVVAIGYLVPPLGLPAGALLVYRANGLRREGARAGPVAALFVLGALLCCYGVLGLTALPANTGFEPFPAA
jgi:hypothetical protein